jgi:tripartite-type tricarboxylate transporter receptor subunit TctC
MMKSNSKRAAIVIALALIAVTGPANADPADFYKGKTFEILVGFSAGGGYDAYARALARGIGKYIPGNPTVVVKNMAGAGSLRMSMFLQDAAPRDGLTIGTMDPGLQITPLIKPDTASFNASKLTWIGSIAKNTYVCASWHTGRVKTVDDLLKAESAFGVTGKDDVRYMNTAILKNLLGAKIKIVSGYPGSNDVRLALERGEIDGECDGWNSLQATKSDWLRDNKLTILAQMTLAKHPDLPNTPVVAELVKDKTQKAALEFLIAPQESGRPFAAPPGIPADRATALRRAFDATMRDPDFLAYAKQATLDVEPTTGEQVESLIREIYKATPEVVELARKAID